MRDDDDDHEKYPLAAVLRALTSTDLQIHNWRQLANVDNNNATT